MGARTCAACISPLNATASATWRATPFRVGEKTRSGAEESSSQPDRSRRVVGMVVEMRPMDVLTFRLK